MSDQLKEVAREYAKQYPRIAEADRRKVKGEKIAAILKDVLSGISPEYIVDIGASGCIPVEEVSNSLDPGLAIGVDLDVDILPRPSDRVSPMLADAMQLPFPDNSLDVVICNHVYEHVGDSEGLMIEMFRVLKPGGVVYFGAMNARWPIEPHYDIPFLHWMPEFLAEKLVRKKGFNHGYLERPLTTAGLRQLVSSFEVIDYTVPVVSNPEGYSATDVVSAGWAPAGVRKLLAKLLFGLLPSYIWILKKPVETVHSQ